MQFFIKLEQTKRTRLRSTASLDARTQYQMPERAEEDSESSSHLDISPCQLFPLVLNQDPSHQVGRLFLVADIHHRLIRDIHVSAI